MKEAKLSAVKAGAMQQEYLSWTFADVLVTSYQTSGSGGDISMDSVSLAFSKVRVEYRAQKADGSLDAPVVAGWDAKANKKL
jgi:type VI secretion system secreted protein Hcp